MKKIFQFVSLFAFLAALLFPQTLMAASSLSQNDQYYSVVFDKEGEAAVTAKLTFTNRAKDEIKDLTLKIPGTKVRIVSVIIQDRPLTKYCISYDYSKSVAPNVIRPCLEWGERETGQNTYELADYQQSAGTNETSVKVNLKTPVKSMDTATILIYYKAQGYTTQVWNGSKFNFQTIKTQYDSGSIRVAINVTDDLYLKSTAKSETNYQSDFSLGSTKLDSQAAPATSVELDRFSNNIVYTQGLVKETSSLDPEESFSVQGQYYTNNLWGEAWSIIAIVIVLGIIGFLLGLIIRSENKKNKSH